ncbi:uncharacterized protein LOC119711275 [Motacilla alba alba]|uniref:uncharacterized protein LOC119711275 n=1 Tax=Motacilla alba alba TaxID=1094192 RepID=UPI0018D52A80|nr:uncharacterized protein LOC119711275 [Motacilla alba alba]
MNFAVKRVIQGERCSSLICFRRERITWILLELGVRARNLQERPAQGTRRGSHLSRAPSHLELQARTISLLGASLCWRQTEGEGITPALQSHSVEHRGLPVLVKSFLRSTQKICHPKSTSFPLARSLSRSCLQSRAWGKPRTEQILFHFHSCSGWVLPNQDKQSEYVPEELGLAIWQRTFHRKSCRMLLLLSSVPKEGTIPAPLQPRPLQGLSFLHPKLWIFKDAAARILAAENFGKSRMVLSPRAAWC